MDRKPRTSPDGDARATGASDSYLVELLRQGRPLTDGAAGVSSSESTVWDGRERRSDDVSCFDPYLVDLARGGGSSR